MIQQVISTILILFMAQGGMMPGPGTPHTAGGGGCTMPTTNILADYFADSLTCPSSPTSWADSSTNANTLTVGGGTPTCITNAGSTGHKGVVLNGSSYFDTSAAISCTTTCTVYLVMIPATVGTNAVMGNHYDNTALSWQVPNGSAKQELDEQLTANIGSSTTSLTVSTLQEVSFSYTGGTVAFHLNGTADGGGSGAATISFGTDRIGTNDGTNIFTGTILEMLFYQSGTYDSTVHSCLVTRFGV